MARRLAWIFTLLLLATASAQDQLPRLSVSYAVDASAPESGKIRVAMTVRNNVQDEVKVSIPAWAPGAYRIVKYCRSVWNVEATGRDGKKLEVMSLDDQTWRIKAGGLDRFTISYELSVEKSRMDKDHLFIAGPDTYLYIVDRKDAPCSVGFTLPEGWKVGTGLDPDGPVYKARDYDTFIDCPTELGKFELLSFEADGATYDIVIHSKGPVDGEKIVDMCRRIVVSQNRMFGGPPPFKRYVFLYHFKDQSGGRGLEHLNSTDISMPYAAIKFDPLLAASVTSHEYFHLWNVKRIRPVELGPFDYTGIVRSKALWMCEGVTSYYGDRTLAHNGIWKEQQYLDHLAGEIETLQNNPDRKVTSVEKASQNVWDRKDYPRVDYYNKGELLGLLLDLKIRTASGGTKTFDDVVRLLYDRYVVGPSKEGRGAIGVGYPEDGILKALNEITGSDWKPFYDAHIRGLEELPFKDVMEAAGLAPAITIVDTPDLGLDLRGTYVVFVSAGGEAEKAGIKQGDRLSAINDVEITRQNLREMMGQLMPGEEARLQLLRGEGKFDVAITPRLKQRTTCKLRRAENPTAAQKRILDAWLGKAREY